MNQFLSNKIIAGIVALALLVGVGVLISSGDTSSTTRNAALVVATPCTKPGQVTKVSKQSVVCATTNTGSLWYATMKAKGKAQACKSPGAIRKKSDIVWVCGVVKKKKLWQATQPLLPAVVASTTGIEPGATQPTPALESTQVATPLVPVVADNAVLADTKIPDDKTVTKVTVAPTTPTGPLVPSAPTAVVATAADASAVVRWTAPVRSSPRWQREAGSIQATEVDLDAPYESGKSIRQWANCACARFRWVSPTRISDVYDTDIVLVDTKLPVTGYTVTSSPGARTCTTTTLSCTVTGLTNGTPYTFTVIATNAVGNSVPSAASTAVTPTVAPTTPTVAPTTPTAIPETYQVGNIGPGGGIVFYVAPTINNSPMPFDCGENPNATPATTCTYLEAAITDGTTPSTWKRDTTAQWGCNGTDVMTSDQRTASLEIGQGRANTKMITEQACKGTNDSLSAASIAKAYNGGGKTDWFLPSRKELDALCFAFFKGSIIKMYSLDTCMGSGNTNSVSGKTNRIAWSFAADIYWSSSEYFAYLAWSQNFSNGNQFSNPKDNAYYVRPVRAF